MEQQKSVGIWIRVSTEDQAKGESPEHHEKRARLYAEAKGWDVRVVYHLEAISGKSVMHHPETQKMLEDIRKGYITGIIFSKLARLARNTRELLDFADIFRAENADLISLQEAIDTSTPAGRLFYTMIAAMAQWEREEISERVAASVPIRAKLGKPIGGQASFGYRWDGKHLVIDEKEAPIRKLIYELFLTNKRKKTTARLLNEMGHRTRNGSKFSDTTIDRLIRDPTAKGERRANYTKSLGDNKKWVMKPTSEWVIIPCPPLIEEELWRVCNQVLDDQLNKRKRVGPRAVHLLSGFIYCTCGKKMYVFHENAVYNCKTCKLKVAVADIDEIYHEQLKDFLLTESDISDYMKKTDTALKEKEELLAMTSKEVVRIQKEMDRLVKLRVNEELNRESFARQFKPLEDQLGELEHKLPELQAETDFLRIEHLSSDVVLGEAKTLYNQWLTLPFEEKRTIVETITEKIVIGKEDIHFSLSYFPSAVRNAGKKQRGHRDSWLR